jgi:hypothetical protein
MRKGWECLRHCERSEASQKKQELDCFVASLLAMTIFAAHTAVIRAQRLRRCRGRSRALARRLDGRPRAAWFETRRCATLLTMRVPPLIQRSRALARRLDGWPRAAWFETRRCATLLTMRVPPLILRSRALARRLEGWPQAAWFETRRCATLLTMRVPPLILRSRALARRLEGWPRTLVADPSRRRLRRLLRMRAVLG